RPHTLPTHYCVCRFVSLLPTLPPLFFPSLFFFNVPAPSEIYTLSLHDALPILHYAVHACLVLIHRLRRFSLRRYCQPHWSRVDPALAAGHHALWHDHRQPRSPPHHAWKNHTHRRWLGHHGRRHPRTYCRKCGLNPSRWCAFIPSWIPHYISWHPAHLAANPRAVAHPAIGQAL